MSRLLMINMVAEIPKNLPPVNYFLKEINNSQSLFLIRVLAAVIFMILLAVPYYNSKKQKINGEESE